MREEKKSDLVISYENLRRMIGILGMALPFACAIGGALFTHIGIQPSISDYYYTNMQDIFVGILVGVAMFLVTYKGYDKRDQYITSGAGIASVGIALLPTNIIGKPLVRVGVFDLTSKTSNIFHSIFAILFFGLLAYMSIFLFTLSNPDTSISKNKRRRNRIYIICGCIMVAGIVGIILSMLLMPFDAMLKTKIIFYIETCMLEAFGISWLVKGKTILKD